MLQAPIVFCLFVLSFFSATAFGQNKQIEGAFYSNGHYAGLTIVFKTDMTFTLKYHGHIYSDTAAGIYQLKTDTISLSYVYNNFDTIYAFYKQQNKQIPIDVQLNASRAILRPTKLVKKRSKLYLIDDTTGYLKMYEIKGRRYLVYLQ